MSNGDAIADVEAIVAAGGDADDVLRAVVASLAERYAWAGIFFVEAGELVLGPEAGRAQPDARTQIPVSWNGRNVAELAVDGAPEAERAALGRVAGLVADHCLVGWDTRGEAWAP
jgi:putative methionine-R-sulfoxide reductase with GAF domain